jgi:hypothetical protein
MVEFFVGEFTGSASWNALLDLNKFVDSDGRVMRETRVSQARSFKRRFLEVRQ